MNLSRIGPGGKAGNAIELLKKTADNLVGVGRGTQSIELCHHVRERLLHVADRALGKVLTLRIEAALALDEFFAVEIGQRIESGIGLRTRIGEET